MMSMKRKYLLNDSQLKELRRLFLLISAGKNKDTKIMTQIIRMQNKNKQKFYKDNAFEEKEIQLQKMDIEDLIKKKFLKVMSKKDKKYLLPLKTIILFDYGLEQDLDKKTENLIDDLNKMFFEKVVGLSDVPIDSKEKAIIITLLGLGAYSDKYLFQPNEKNAKSFQEAVNIAVEFLKGLGESYSSKLDSFWNRKVTGEGPILSEMRRLNTIEPRTEGIYKRAKNKGHYLDILTNNRLNESRFRYILEKIFDKSPLVYENKKKFVETLEKIQKFEYKFFKNEPLFNMLEIRRKIRYIIES